MQSPSSLLGTKLKPLLNGSLVLILTAQPQAEGQSEAVLTGWLFTLTPGPGDRIAELRPCSPLYPGLALICLISIKSFKDLLSRNRIQPKLN